MGGYYHKHTDEELIRELENGEYEHPLIREALARLLKRRRSK